MSGALGLLVEAQRCLKPGGKLLIIPLNVAAQAYVETDPDLWMKKQVYKPGAEPLFRRDVPVHLAKIGQTYSQFHDAQLLASCAAQVPELRFEIVTIDLEEIKREIHEKSWLALLATKV